MDDERELSIAKTDYREAYNTGNVELLLSIFDDGFTDMTENQPSFYGDEASTVLRHRVSELFSRYNVKLTVTIITFVIRGDFAFDLGWENFTLTPKGGGEPTSSRYRYFETWRKNKQGKWRIIGFMSNRDMPPAMLPR